SCNGCEIEINSAFAPHYDVAQFGVRLVASPRHADGLLVTGVVTRNMAAYERRSLAIGSHWPIEEWRRFLPEHTTAVSLLNRLLRHAGVVVTEGESFRLREAKARGGNMGLMIS
ncbi:MAG TPA: ATP-binding protein, partial [Acidimicrobiales bacterium]|nr:ATP-binding protein [Acidimicrobiales bacterium]